MGLAFEVKDGAGSERVCLDIATASSTAASESRQSGLATAVNAVVEAGTGDGEDFAASSQQSAAAAASSQQLSSSSSQQQ